MSCASNQQAAESYRAKELYGDRPYAVIVSGLLRPTVSFSVRQRALTVFRARRNGHAAAAVAVAGAPAGNPCGSPTPGVAPAAAAA